MERTELIQQFADTTQAMLRAWKSQFFAELGDDDLPPAQVGLLFLLGRMQPATGSEIADELHISRSAVTQVLDAVVQKGLAERQHDPQDRRTARILLTAAGGAKLQQLEAVRTRLTRQLSDGLSDDELQAAISINRKLLQAFKH